MNYPRCLPAALSLVLVLVLAAPAAFAQDLVPVPVGDPLLIRETQLNPDDSTVDYFDPSFAGRPGGGFLAGWSRVVNGNPDPDQIQVQAFNRLDREVGPVRDISTPFPSEGVVDRGLALASANGRTAAAWARSSGLVSTIFLRVLNSAGQPTSVETSIGSGVSGGNPAVAISPAGLVLVVWPIDDGGSRGLVGRIFNAQGVGMSPQIDIDGGTDVAGDASAGVDDDGNFLIAWHDSVFDDSVVYARWIDVIGNDVVPTFQVAGPTALDPSVSVAPDGRAVVAWSTCVETGADPCNVELRLLGEDGLPDGPAQRANPLDGRAHERPAVGMSDDGDFGLAWRACSLNPVGARFDCLVTASFHDPDGDRYGNRLQMERNGEPTRFTVVPLGDDFVVGWFRFSCDSLSCDPGFESVYAQRYRLVDVDGPGGDEIEIFPEIPEGAPALTSPDFPDFRFYVRIGRPGSDRFGVQEPDCLPETICVSGALPGRTEVQLRIIGPRDNGFLWPTIVKFTTSTVEVWIERISTQEIQYYGLEGSTPGSSELPGLFDRTGFPEI
jgi:hypothetical protein